MLVAPIEDRVQHLSMTSGQTVVELKEKLAWLPMNLSQLQGMNPTEARLFILEARLRSEENCRIQLQHDLGQLRERVSSPFAKRTSEDKSKTSFRRAPPTITPEPGQRELAERPLSIMRRVKTRSLESASVRLPVVSKRVAE